MHLKPEEVDVIRDEVFSYIAELRESGKVDYNATVQLIIPLEEERFIAVNLIVNIFQEQPMFWIVNLQNATSDEYLDVLGNNLKNK